MMNQQLAGCCLKYAIAESKRCSLAMLGLFRSICKDRERIPKCMQNSAAVPKISCASQCWTQSTAQKDSTRD